jgi:hypothetical protein
MAVIQPRDDGVNTQRYSVQNGIESRYNSSTIKERLAGRDGPGVDFFGNSYAEGFKKTPLIGFSNFKGVGFGGSGTQFNYTPYSRT